MLLLCVDTIHAHMIVGGWHGRRDRLPIPPEEPALSISVVVDPAVHTGPPAGRDIADAPMPADDSHELG